MEVTLELYEMEMAATVGVKRRADSLSKKRKGHKNGSWQHDIEGALAECAAAKALKMYWSGSVNTFKSKGDVQDLEVRHTEREDGKLIIRPKDSSTALYVLVRGSAPTYDVVGYISGEDAMEQKYMRNPGGKGVAFFVPEADLTKIK